MADYFLRKKKKDVDLYLAGPPSVSGYVFVDLLSRHHTGPDRVFELLEGYEQFFAFEQKDGGLLIIRKDAVQKVVVDAKFELEIYRSVGKDALLSEPVAITMDNGSVEQGELLIEPREGASRMSDELNRSRGFLKLLVDEHVHILGIEHISSVRESGTKNAKKKKRR